jgi:uncharacterized protein (TIGR03067 family)
VLQALGLLAAVLVAPPDQDSRREQATLEGDWSMVSVEADGAKMSDQQVAGLSLTFKAGNFTSRNKGDTTKFGDQSSKRNGTYTVDPTKNPKVLDIVHAEGPERGKTWSLIYALDGNTLKICGATEAGKERPANFDSGGKKGYMLMILRRQ